MTDFFEVTTAGPEETRSLGERLGSLLAAGDVLAVQGGLGAGKTTFAQGIGKGLQVRGSVTSPTFTIINEYSGRLPLYHFDTYRLEDADEMNFLGYEEYFEGDGVTLIEWADRVAETLPGERLDITVERTGENSRLFRFMPRGQRYEQLVEELKRVVCVGD
ncbi:MAG: tRNA (adenosine(37)-N6)-threonylcarbamoyltransferase complex ATPase subunit type 1 TsaE [Bacillota bacterium]|uniref:tRNA (adenosine(37)-N6)-threonylcarbamoyltransferase complex ATPase subunit type 1 TsaE n=1 Tax=Desulforudis sp. DRI-14 TaxID=3459793 RepID=UPI00349A73C7